MYRKLMRRAFIEMIAHLKLTAGDEHHFLRNVWIAGKPLAENDCQVSEVHKTVTGKIGLRALSEAYW